MSLDHLIGFIKSTEQFVLSVEKSPEKPEIISTKVTHLFESFKKLTPEQKQNQAPLLRGIVIGLENNERLAPALKHEINSLNSALKGHKLLEHQSLASSVTLSLIKNQAYVGQLSEEKADLILRAEKQPTWLLRYDTKKGAVIVSYREKNTVHHEIITSLQHFQQKFKNKSEIDAETIRILEQNDDKSMATILDEKRNNPQIYQIINYAQTLNRDLRIPLAMALKNYPYNLQLLEAFGIASYTPRGAKKQLLGIESEEKILQRSKEIDILKQKDFFVGSISLQEAEKLLKEIPTNRKFLWLARVSEQHGMVITSLTKEIPPAHREKDKRTTPFFSHFTFNSIALLEASTLNFPDAFNQDIDSAIRRDILSVDPQPLFERLSKAYLGNNQKMIDKVIKYAAEMNVDIKSTLQKSFSIHFAQEFAKGYPHFHYLEAFLKYPGMISWRDFIISLYNLPKPPRDIIEDVKDFLIQKQIPLQKELEDAFKANPTREGLLSIIRGKPSPLYRIVAEIYAKGDPHHIDEMNNSMSSLELNIPYVTEGAYQEFVSQKTNPPRLLLRRLADAYIQAKNYAAALPLLERYRHLAPPQVNEHQLTSEIFNAKNDMKQQQARITNTLKRLGIPIPQGNVNLEQLVVFLYQQSPLRPFLDLLSDNPNANFDDLLNSNLKLMENKDDVIRLVKELFPIAQRAQEHGLI